MHYSLNAEKIHSQSSPAAASYTDVGVTFLLKVFTQMCESGQELAENLILRRHNESFQLRNIPLYILYVC